MPGRRPSSSRTSGTADRTGSPTHRAAARAVCASRDRPQTARSRVRPRAKPSRRPRLRGEPAVPMIQRRTLAGPTRRFSPSSGCPVLAGPLHNASNPSSRAADPTPQLKLTSGFACVQHRASASSVRVTAPESTAACRVDGQPTRNPCTWVMPSSTIAPSSAFRSIPSAIM
jgi:hypothetical protein